MNGCNVFSSLSHSHFHSLLLWLAYALYMVRTSTDDIACHFINFFFYLFQWAGNKSLLAVNSGETVIILNEQVMNAHYNLEVSDLQ